ncbi:MAG: MarR family transcriptional regulator [Kutzneria sp.]|nr:MarR family transcriptional regulator [Kutzneria sp.]
MNGEGPVRSSRQLAAEFPEMDPSAADVVINLVHACAMATDALGRQLRPHGLTPTGFRILAIIRIAGRPLRPAEIARQLRVTSGTVTGLLDSLQKAGLIRRVPHPSDRRMMEIELTPAAHRLQRHVFPVQFAAEKQMCGLLGPSERETLVRLLGKLQAAMLTSDDRPPARELNGHSAGG